MKTANQNITEVEKTDKTGDIILSQIKTLDSKALRAWGTRKLFYLPETEKHLGGLRLIVTNNPKVRVEAFVDITLNGNDLYDIRVYKERYKTIDGVRNYFTEEFGSVYAPHQKR